MKTIAITNSIIKGRKSDFYIGKKIKDIDGDVVGTVINASVNKRFKRVYLDIEINDDYNDDGIEINVNIYKNPKTKRNHLILTERKLKRRYKRRK